MKKLNKAKLSVYDTTGKLCKIDDITGEQQGKLTAIEFDYKTETSGSMWKFLCECGRIKTIRAADVRIGKTKSCGCLTPIRKNKSNSNNE